MKYLKLITILLISLFILTSCSFTGTGEVDDVNSADVGTEQNVATPNDSNETPTGIAPGLYNTKTGELKYAWEELEVRSFITVKEGFITNSVEYLRGDLYIPNNVYGIAKKAFNNCTGLTRVYIGDGVTTINDSAFYGCTGLVSVEFGNGITNIASKAFGYCTRLSEAIIPDSVTNIGASAFGGCTGLTNVYVGDEVTNISKSAFSGCTGLESIRLGKNLTHIGASAFHNCNVLSSVEYPGTYSDWNSIFIDKKNTKLTDAASKMMAPKISEPDVNQPLDGGNITE